MFHYTPRAEPSMPAPLLHLPLARIPAKPSAGPQVVIQYFGFIYVAFLANYAPLFPGEHCPSLNCLPVLTVMLLTETILVTSYQASPPPRPSAAPARCRSPFRRVGEGLAHSPRRRVALSPPLHVARSPRRGHPRRLLCGELPGRCPAATPGSPPSPRLLRPGPRRGTSPRPALCSGGPGGALRRVPAVGMRVAMLVRPCPIVDRL